MLSTPLFHFTFVTIGVETHNFSWKRTQILLKPVTSKSFLMKDSCIRLELPTLSVLFEEIKCSMDHPLMASIFYGWSSFANPLKSRVLCGFFRSQERAWPWAATENWGASPPLPSPSMEGWSIKPDPKWKLIRWLYIDDGGCFDWKVEGPVWPDLEQQLVQKERDHDGPPGLVAQLNPVDEPASPNSHPHSFGVKLSLDLLMARY